MNRSSRRWALAALGLVLLAPWACLSPTLPLPPPSRPDTIEPDQQGYVRLAGTVPPRGVANAFNLSLTLQAGVFQRTGDDGQYDFVIRAQAGDQILFWYNLNGEDSPAIRFEIPAPPP